jgi:hypothetical protein
MDDGHYISETIHKRHALKFWVKMWCLSHLRDCSKLSVMTLNLNPFMTQQPFGIAPSKEETSRKVRKNPLRSDLDLMKLQCHAVFYLHRPISKELYRLF